MPETRCRTRSRRQRPETHLGRESVLAIVVVVPAPSSCQITPFRSSTRGPEVLPALPSRVVGMLVP